MIHLKEVENKGDYVTARYLSLKLKQIPGSWLWYNGNQGLRHAIVYSQFSDSYENACKELSYENSETVEAIKNDYQNWYYKIPVEEAIEIINHDVKYYSPCK